MTRAVVCEQCHKTQEYQWPTPLLAWITLEPTDIWVGALGEKSLPLDFCSWHCLGAYAASRSSRLARPHAQPATLPAPPAPKPLVYNQPTGPLARLAAWFDRTFPAKGEE